MPAPSIPIHSSAASSEDVRDINRRIILNFVRTRQPVSRADLARASGMQRSTVSLIVDELMAENWVIEGDTGRLPRGRRPTFLRLNDDRVIIGVDVRPLHTTIALADINGIFTSQEIMPTPPDPKRGLRLILERIQRIISLSSGKKIEGIGISLPGRFNPVLDRFVFAPNLPWKDADLRGPIAKATGLEVELENAANACVLAAVWFNGMEACKNLVVVTVSEGIGAGLLINGQLARGQHGMAGEFGHVPLDPNGPPCGCGRRGCWEVFASNSAALRYYFESDVRAPHSSALTFPDLLQRAGQCDARAAYALETMARYLGRGMRMMVAGLAPERIVVIGDLTRDWNRFGPLIEDEIRAQVLPGAMEPVLVPLHEGGTARLRGTVALVLQKHFGPAAPGYVRRNARGAAS